MTNSIEFSKARLGFDIIMIYSNNSGDCTLKALDLKVAHGNSRIADLQNASGY